MVRWEDAVCTSGESDPLSSGQVNLLRECKLWRRGDKVGLWARRDRIQHHRDNVVKREKGGKKKERWEGR